MLQVQIPFPIIFPILIFFIDIYYISMKESQERMTFFEFKFYSFLSKQKTIWKQAILKEEKDRERNEITGSQIENNRAVRDQRAPADSRIIHTTSKNGNDPSTTICEVSDFINFEEIPPKPDIENIKATEV